MTIVDRTANNVRGAPARIDEPLDDIDLVNPDDTDDGYELSADVERAAYYPEPSAARDALERFTRRPLPTLRGVAHWWIWWTHHLALALLQVTLHPHEIAWHQVKHTGRGIAMASGTYARWRAKPDWMSAAKVAEEKDRAKRVSEVEHHKRNSTNLTVVALAVAAGLAAWLLYSGRSGHLLTAIAALLLVLNLVGRKESPVSAPVDLIPASPFREGAPSSRVVADVKAVLVERGHDVERLAVVEPRNGDYGMTMTVHSPRPLDDQDALAIERGCQTFRGAVTLLADPSNAAISELRMLFRDPLAASAAPLRLAPLSVSVSDAAVLGYGYGGTPLELNLMRTNVIIVGAPGSGKSSTLWAMIDWLSCCRDVILHGIDLSGGPALRVWGEVFATRAFNKADAKRLLEEGLARAHARTEMLAVRSEPTLESDEPPQSENWTPADGKFHITIIDELPLLAADQELRELYAEHQRIGRKAGDTSICATQDLGGDTLKSTSLRKYPSTLIMHACSREDVTGALGGGKIAQGWTPHRLVPAEGDSPNDAGKAFLLSGRHTRPVPWRFARLDDIGEIHSRARERIRAGRPVDDDPITPTGDDGVVAGAVVPSLIAEILAVFGSHGDPAFLPTEQIVADLNAQRAPDRQLTPRDLGARLKLHGVESRRSRIANEQFRGYRLEHLQQVTE